MSKSESKEVVPVTADALALLKKIQKDKKTYIELLKQTFKTSDQYPDICKKGDWFFKGENLGSSVKMTVLCFAFRVVAIKDKTFAGKIMWPSTEIKYSLSKEYKDFKNKHDDADKFDEAPCALVYLPEYEDVGAVFLKGGLFNGGLEILSNSMLNKSSEVTGRAEPGNLREPGKKKNEWVELDVEQIPLIKYPDDVSKKIELFFEDKNNETKTSGKTKRTI